MLSRPNIQAPRRLLPRVLPRHYHLTQPNHPKQPLRRRRLIRRPVPLASRQAVPTNASATLKDRLKVLVQSPLAVTYAFAENLSSVDHRINRWIAPAPGFERALMPRRDWGTNSAPASLSPAAT